MVTLGNIYLAVNAIFLTIIFFLTFIIARAGSIYSFQIGDYELQTKLKWVILRSLVAMVAVGLLAALSNFVLQPF